MFAKTIIFATLATLALAAPPTPVNELAARQTGGGLADLLGSGGAGGLVSTTVLPSMRLVFRALEKDKESQNKSCRTKQTISHFANTVLWNSQAFLEVLEAPLEPPQEAAARRVDLALP